MIGWYIHHQGGGHLSRFLALRTHLDMGVVCFSSLPEPSTLPPHTQWIHLELDDVTEMVDDGAPRDPRESSPTAAGLLHWAPLGHRGHAQRFRRIADAIIENNLRTFVVDVSVEVALFVRLMGIAPVVFAQPGNRVDEPHLLAYRVAERIIAPWPSGLVDAPQLDSFRDLVIYTGGISRYEGRTMHATRQPLSVLLLGGRGGTSATMALVNAAQYATPKTEWKVLGVPDSIRSTAATWVDDPWPLMTSAEIVVSWAGQNSVADLAVAGAHAIVIPQERPFEEQRTTARALEIAELAIVSDTWPCPFQWPELLERARKIEPKWERWQTDGAGARAAEAIDDIAKANR